MAATSEERREVAEQLREARPSTYDAEELVELIKDSLLPAFPTETWREPTDVLASLADLIDPTCEVVGDNTYTSDYDFRCKTCGEHFSAASTPRYCPGCGRRIDYGDR